MRSVRILEEATQEAEAATAWYETEKIGLGRQFFEAVEAAIDLIEEGIMPLLTVAGSARKIGAQRLILARFPYDIVVVERSHETIVIAVAHHARKPGYWRKRLKSPSRRA